MNDARRRASPEHSAHSGKDLAQSSETLCPDFPSMTMQWVFAGAPDQPRLDLATRELVVIACRIGQYKLDVDAWVLREKGGDCGGELCDTE